MNGQRIINLSLYKMKNTHTDRSLLMVNYFNLQSCKNMLRLKLDKIKQNSEP